MANKKRLLKLADFLETVPAKKFSLEAWETIDGEECVEEQREPGACGTTACACGWATAIPSFRRAGFHMILEYGVLEPRYKDNEGWGAVQSFFELDSFDSHLLFDPDAYPRTRRGVKSVVKRIRDYCKAL